MKNTFKLMSVLTFAFVISLSSCKKDEETKTDKDYLTAGNWKVTGMVLSPGITLPGGVVITDVFDMLIEDCTKDDLINFNIDGTLVEDEGATKCEPDDPQTTTDGTWTLSEDNQTITITYPGETPEVATIITLNATTLVVSNQFSDELLGDEVFTATITMMLQ